MPNLSHKMCISTFVHCGLCLRELQAPGAPESSPRDYAQLEVGFTKQGLQVWCKRHECNVMHIDFEGQRHPANTTRPKGPHDA